MNFKVKFLIALGLLLVMFSCLYFWYFNASRIFERKFYFSLPKSAQVEKSSYSIFDDELYIKIEFEPEDYSTVLENLEKYYGGSSELEKDMKIPEYKGICKWWDMQVDEVIVAHRTFGTGPWGRKTRAIYSFITKSSDDKYFLYCVN